MLKNRSSIIIFSNGYGNCLGFFEAPWEGLKINISFDIGYKTIVE